VNWNSIALVEGNGIWTGQDFAIAFNRMKSNVKDHAVRPFVEIVDEIYKELQSLPEQRRYERFQINTEPTGAIVADAFSESAVTGNAVSGPSINPGSGKLASPRRNKKGKDSSSKNNGKLQGRDGYVESWSLKTDNRETP